MGFNGIRVRNRWGGGLTVPFPRGIMVAQDKEVGELHERFRRLAAGGWLDILALVLAVVVIVVLSICTNLDDVAEAISKQTPARHGANYGGALVSMLAVFAVFVVQGELALGGVICAAAGISILIGGKKCADARLISRIRSGIAADAVFLVLNGSTEEAANGAARTARRSAAAAALHARNRLILNPKPLPGSAKKQRYPRNALQGLRVSWSVGLGFAVWALGFEGAYRVSPTSW